jgi:AraC-like DNA-binding protein
MRVTAIAPSARLAPFVRTFTVVEAAEESTRVLIPDTGLVLGLRYAGSAELLRGAGNGNANGNGSGNGNGHGHFEAAVRMPDASVTGMRETVRRMRTSAGGGAIFAMFQPGGAAPFFAEPLHELFGETVPLDDLSNPSPAGVSARAQRERDEIERAVERLTAAADDATRVKIVEEYLLARYLRRAAAAPQNGKPAPKDVLIAEAVRAIRAARGAIRIAPLAKTLGIGLDRLEKRFRAAVGTSPKQLASLIRLRRAIESYRPDVSLASLSADAGYFDQSHFTREVRAVTGEPPQRFFRTREHC